MNYSNKVCSFTGYRSQKLHQALGDNDIEELKDKLRAEISGLLNRDFTVFRCGMALGADMLFADVVLEFKRRYPGVRLEAVIPCLGQDKAWNEKQREKYHYLIENANQVILVSNSDYFDGCMQIRNRYLAENCDLLLAVFDGKRGGTMQTVEYAKKLGRKITIIDPATMLKITLIEQLRL
jgi:uncharacterized phage-like protein YoqJ